MSARGQKSTPASDAVSPAHTIPLSDVTITCYRPAHFVGEEGQTPITITGRQLGQALAWLAKTRPGRFDGSADDLWSPEDVALKVEGLGEVLLGLGMADLENIPLDVPSVFCLLAEVTSDLAARLHASEDGDKALKRATITLPTRKEAAA